MTTTLPTPFRRSTHTWMLYLVFAVFGYVINALGPVTPFLKAELHLSYTVSSLVFSAFATGMILTGLVGHLLIDRLGRGRTLWLGLFGMCLGMLGLALARTAWMTIGASFLTGCIGTLVPTVVPAVLADEHGENRATALSEYNLLAAIASAGAPLMVGWFSYTVLGWRFGLAIPLLASLALFVGMGWRVRVQAPPARPVAGPETRLDDGKLPTRYWAFWLSLVLAVATEYCMLAWCADYLVHVAGLPRPVAAQAVSIFLAGEILGRVAGSRVVRRFGSYRVVSVSILIAAVGFSLYWIALARWMPVVGLFVTGLGVANQFPLILSLALGAAEGKTVQASTRASLASGIAIFVLPLVLGRLADAAGIRLAYGLVAILLMGAFTIIQLAARRERGLAAAAG